MRSSLARLVRSDGWGLPRNRCQTLWHNYRKVFEAKKIERIKAIGSTLPGREAIWRGWGNAAELIASEFSRLWLSHVLPQTDTFVAAFSHKSSWNGTLRGLFFDFMDTFDTLTPKGGILILQVWLGFKPGAADGTGLRRGEFASFFPLNFSFQFKSTCANGHEQGFEEPEPSPLPSVVPGDYFFVLRVVPKDVSTERSAHCRKQSDRSLPQLRVFFRPPNSAGWGSRWHENPKEKNRFRRKQKPRSVCVELRCGKPHPCNNL